MYTLQGPSPPSHCVQLTISLIFRYISSRTFNLEIYNGYKQSNILKYYHRQHSSLLHILFKFQDFRNIIFEITNNIITKTNLDRIVVLPVSHNFSVAFSFVYQKVNKSNIILYQKICTHIINRMIGSSILVKKLFQ